MSESAIYRPAARNARDRAHTLFGQTMGYVAMTAGLFALGAYLGRDLHGSVGILAFLAAFGALIGMQFAIRKSVELSVGLLAAFGLLMGLAVAPTLAYYASADPAALWQAGGATALFIAGFGVGGLRHTAGSDRDRARRSVGARRPDRLQHRADLRRSQAAH